MASKRTKISSLAVILFFALGVWCSNLAASNLPIFTPQQGELEPGCAEASLVFGRIECKQLDIACSSGLVPRSSKITLASVPSDNLLKGGKLRVIEGFLPRMSDKISLLGQQAVATSRIVAVPKTPLHLFQAVLLL